jgi:signal peptidase I
MRIDASSGSSKDSQSVEHGIQASQPANAASALVASPESLGPQQLLDRIRERGHIVLRVAGGSMGPWFLPGDFIIVQEVEPPTVRRGDVVVFQRRGLLIAHRVIKLLGGGSTGELCWKTKGDSAERSDPLVFERELVGRVAFVERAGRSFSLQSPVWIAAGRALALLSPSSRFWYPVARFIRRLYKPQK